MSKISKLGFGIIVFDDVCHLRNIVSEIRDLCDEIVICLQNESYHGVPINEDVVKYVNILKNKGIVDDIIMFKNTKKYKDAKSAPREVEADKRNFILDFLEKDCGCSHTMVIDSDEFYDHDEFKNAKEIINNNDEIVISYCQYINYYRDYTHILVWPFKCYVPFITEARFRFDFNKGSFNLPSDPTRRYVIENPADKFCVMSFNAVKMHHLSWIRINIEDKVDNWSAKKYFENVEGLRDRMIHRYNNYKDGDNAIIMFNVPEYSVVVNKLDQQYIFPKYKIDDFECE